MQNVSVKYPSTSGARREIREGGFDRGDVGGLSVERHVRLREHLGVTRGVDRGDVRTAALQLLRDARGAGEQVEGAARARDRRDRAQYRHQPSFRTDVLDHVG